MKLLIIAASVEALWETLKMFWDGSKVDVNRIGSAILEFFSASLRTLISLRW